MAMKISDECINCGSCEPECPNKAISQGSSVYVVDAAKCTECVGAFDSPKCVELCPVDGCITSDGAETKDQLQAKYATLHA